MKFAIRYSTLAVGSEPRHSCRADHPRDLKVAALMMLMLFATSSAFAQTGNGYDLTWSTIDSGGQTFSTGNGYELGGTIGQADAGELTGDNGYALTGGFWAAGVPCACQLYGDMLPLPDGDCDVNLDDILCVLDDFADLTLCSSTQSDVFPCMADLDPSLVCSSNEYCLTNFGVPCLHGRCANVDLDDILAVLDAFAGTFSCPHPCPP